MRFLGKKATTNSEGIAKITVRTGTAKGKHKAAAAKSGYSGAAVTVRVT